MLTSVRGQERDAAAAATATTDVPNLPVNHTVGPSTGSGKPRESVSSVSASPIVACCRNDGRTSGSDGCSQRSVSRATPRAVERLAG